MGIKHKNHGMALTLPACLMVGETQEMVGLDISFKPRPGIRRTAGLKSSLL